MEIQSEVTNQPTVNPQKQTTRKSNSKGRAGVALFKNERPELMATGNFTQIPNELILHKDLTSNALRVLLFFLTKPPDWVIYNVHSQIKAATGLGHVAVERALKQLRDLKLLYRLIKGKRRSFENGYFFSQFLTEPEVVDEYLRDRKGWQRYDKKRTSEPTRSDLKGDLTSGVVLGATLNHGDSNKTEKENKTKVFKNSVYPKQTRETCVSQDDQSFPKQNKRDNHSPTVNDSITEPQPSKLPPSRDSLLGVSGDGAAPLTPDLDSLIDYWGSKFHYQFHLNWPRYRDTKQKQIEAFTFLLSRYSLNQIRSGIDVWTDKAFALENASAKLWNKTTWDLVTDKQGNLGQGGELISILNQSQESKPIRLRRRLNLGKEVLNALEGR